MLVTLSRYARWLISALGLQDPEIPTELGEDTIAPTLDVYQGGWGNAEFVSERATLDGPQPGGTTITLIEPDADLTRVLWAIHYRRINPTGAELTLPLQYVDPAGSNPRLTVSQFAAGASGFIETDDALGVLYPLLVPPGQELRVTISEGLDGVGPEGLRINFTVGTFRAGFKVL